MFCITYLDEQVTERLRFRMKNEVKVLYRFVLENMKILKDYKEGKIGKYEVQSRYVKVMAEQLEEKVLRALDNE